MESEVLGCWHCPWGSSDLASLLGYARISSSCREADPWQNSDRYSKTESQVENQRNFQRNKGP